MTESVEQVVLKRRGRSISSMYRVGHGCRESSRKICLPNVFELQRLHLPVDSM